MIARGVPRASGSGPVGLWSALHRKLLFSLWEIENRLVLCRDGRYEKMDTLG